MNVSTLWLFALLAAVLVPASFAQEDRESHSTGLASSIGVAELTVLRQTLGRADLAISGSRINMRHFKGALGEAVTGSYLSRGADWVQVRQELRPQGIDHVHLKVDQKGLIRDLMVSEVKTGQSRLGMTKDGKQMSEKWITPRLRKLSSEYRSLATDFRAGRVQRGPIPKLVPGIQVLELPLAQGEVIQFWRESSTSRWKVAASEKQLIQIETQFDRVVGRLEAASDGKIAYRTRLLSVKPSGGELLITVKDAQLLKSGGSAKLPELETLRIPMSRGRAMEAELAGSLKKIRPLWTDQEIRVHSRELRNQILRSNQGLSQGSQSGVIRRGGIVSASAGGALSGGLDLLGQLWTTGQVDLRQLGTYTAAGATGTLVGHFSGVAATEFLLSNPAGLEITRQVGTSLGLQSTGFSANLLGSALGGTAASAAFSYVLYFAGQVDIETANRMAAAGTIGSLAGVGFLSAGQFFVTAFGAAGTGTAIGSLSGAAASSAIGAWGGGIFAGSGILSSTGVGLVVVGVGALVYVGFEMNDQANELERLELTAEYLRDYYVN